jgi:hypothetical protein
MEKNYFMPGSGVSESLATNFWRLFAANDFSLVHFLRAYARSYMLPPLRG